MQPAIRIVIKAIDGTITTRKANIVEARNSQATVYSDINKILLLPSLQYVWQVKI